MNQVAAYSLPARKKYLRNPTLIAKKPWFLKISSIGLKTQNIEKKILPDSEKSLNFGLETSKYWLKLRFFKICMWYWSQPCGIEFSAMRYWKIPHAQQLHKIPRPNSNTYSSLIGSASQGGSLAGADLSEQVVPRHSCALLSLAFLRTVFILTAITVS